MSKDYVITANNNQEIFRDKVFKGDARTYQFDLSPWAEANNTITGVTWTVEVGQAAISGETLNSNVASALITFSESGGNLIKAVCATGTETYVIWLDVLAKDLKLPDDDYGIRDYR